MQPTSTKRQTASAERRRSRRATREGKPAQQDSSTRDGRHRRRDRSRAAAIDALLRLLASGTTAPSTIEIAEEAGITERTLFNLFDDKAALLWAAVERFRQRALAGLPPVPAEGALEDRVRSIVVALSQWFDDYAAVRWAAVLQGGTVPDIQRGVVQNAVVSLFREIGSQEGIERLPKDVDAALRAAVSAATWRQLRVDLRLSRASSADAVTRMVVALVRDARSSLPGVATDG